MSIFGTGTSDFAPLSGEDNESYANFNDIEVNGRIFLKSYEDTLTGYNVPLITTDKTTDDMIFNTTTLNSNFNFTVGTDQDNKETIFAINPTTGLGFNVNTNQFNIGWDELSYLNSARSNLQQQIDNLNPDLSQNIGYWNSFWNVTDLIAISTNTPYLIPYTASDPSGNGISYNNNSRVQVANSGIYMFILTAQLKSTNSNTGTVQFWIKKNGTNVADSAFKEELKQTTKLVCANWQIALQSNDYVEISWQTDDTSISIEHFSASGNVPQIPSVILTVSQVTYFQSTIAEVTDIKQRITGINYSSPTDTTIISNDLSCNNLITSQIKARDISCNVLDVSNTLIANSNSGIILFHSSAYINMESQIYAHGTYITPQSLSYVSGATSNIQNQINRIDLSINRIDSSINQINSSISGINSSISGINNNLTGISYNSATDTTTVDNSMNVYGKLRIYVNNGDLVPLNSYIDEEVNKAYSHASDAMNQSNASMQRADNAYALADEANTRSTNNSVAIGVITGVTIPAVTASIANLQSQITGLGLSISVLSGQVSVLETKTINQTAVVGVTTFTGQIIIGSTTINPLSILTPTLDAETSVITPTISSNTGTITVTTPVQNYNGTTVNIGNPGSAINIGTSGVSSISIGSIATALTTYICGVPYNPYFPTGFFTQW